MLLLRRRRRRRSVNVLLILVLVVFLIPATKPQDDDDEEEEGQTTTTTTTTTTCPAFRFWDDNNPDIVQYGAPNGCRCYNGMSGLNCGYCDVVVGNDEDDDDDPCPTSSSNSSLLFCRQSFVMDPNIQNYVGYKCRIQKQNSNHQRLGSTLFGGTGGKISFYLDMLTNTTTFSLFDTRNVNEDNRTLDCIMDGCSFRQDGNTTCKTIHCNCTTTTTTTTDTTDTNATSSSSSSSSSFCHPWIEQMVSDENYLAGKAAEIRVIEKPTNTAGSGGLVTVWVDGSPFVEATCAARACTSAGDSTSSTSNNPGSGSGSGGGLLGGLFDNDDEKEAEGSNQDEQDGDNDKDHTDDPGISVESLALFIIILFGGMLVVVLAGALVPILFDGTQRHYQRRSKIEGGGDDHYVPTPDNDDNNDQEEEQQEAANNKNNKCTVLKFKHLTRTIQLQGSSCSSAKEKIILDNVSGSVESGTMLGIMGPSGAGKTSLLNVLAAVETTTRYNQAKVSGHITLMNQIDNDSNGRQQQVMTNTGSGYRRRVAYVHQDDALYGTLTVLECIEYSALLRLPTTMNVKEKRSLVWKTLEELQLVDIAHNRIGTIGHASISGGQRKRVSIGMELVAKPTVLCLDEPTSGLDSSAAYKIMNLLSNLASNYNRIVVLSIHQPSIKSFLIMDQILLLGDGGRVVYNGKPSHVKAYFEERGFVCPQDETVPDYMLDVVSKKTNLHKLLLLNDADATATTGSSFAKWRQDSNVMHQQQQQKQEEEEEVPTKQYSADADSLVPVVEPQQMDAAGSSNDDQTGKEEKSTTHSGGSVLNEITTLFARTAKDTFRNMELFVMQLGISIIVAFFVGAIFNDVSNDLAGFQNRMGAFYFSLSFFGFASFSSMDIFVKERHIFERETGSKMYRAFSYFVAKTVLDVFVLRVAPVTIFSFVFYFLMGLNSSFEKFVVFWATMILFNVCAGIISISIGIASPTVGLANLIAVVWFLIMLLFGGFLINIETMADWFAWLKYLSIYYYAFEILVTNELSGLLLKFDAPGFPTVPVWGEVFVETLGMDVDNQLRDILCLCCLAVAYSLVAYLFLLLRLPQSATTYFKKMQAENRRRGTQMQTSSLTIAGGSEDVIGTTTQPLTTQAPSQDDDVADDAGAVASVGATSMEATV